MRAKFINEDINSILKPKPSNEIEKAKRDEFIRKNKVTPEEAEELAEELRKLNVDAIYRSSYNNPNFISDSPIEIKPYQIIDSNRVILTTPTEKQSKVLLAAIYDNALQTRGVNIKKSTSYDISLSIKEATKLIRKLRLDIKTLPQRGETSDLYNKYQYDSYHDWDANR